nr:helix-turn-helix transcriptional regulator [Mucilaginibacter lappiensis]
MNWGLDPFLYNNETGVPLQVLKLIDLLNTLLHDKQDTFINTSVHAILTAILNLIIGYSISRPDNKTGQVNQSVKIEREFSTLLRTHFKNWKRPADYASALSITVSHLNDTLKETTGKPVSEHIQQYVILEAKRLLFFTDQSIKEIGYSLGYDDPNYFSRLFKKNENITPLEFRYQFRD